MARKLKKIKWSYKEERLLLKLAAASKSVDEIADRMNRAPESIHRVALRSGISLKSETSTGSRQKNATPTER